MNKFYFDSCHSYKVIEQQNEAICINSILGEEGINKCTVWEAKQGTKECTERAFMDDYIKIQGVINGAILI